MRKRDITRKSISDRESYSNTRISHLKIKPSDIGPSVGSGVSYGTSLPFISAIRKYANSLRINKVERAKAPIVRHIIQLSRFSPFRAEGVGIGGGEWEGHAN